MAQVAKQDEERNKVKSALSYDSGNQSSDQVIKAPEKQKTDEEEAIESE